jgi:hypothetical protein
MSQNISNNNTSSIPLSTSTNCMDKLVNKVINYYFLNFIVCLGAFLNFVAAFLFIIIIKKEKNYHGHMYKYLFLKSICDGMGMFVETFNIAYLHPNGTKESSLIMIVWFKWFHYYLRLSFLLASAYFEVAAVIDCFILVKGSIERFKSKRLFYVVVVTVLVLSFLFYVPILYVFTIVRKDDGTYKYGLGKFASTKLNLVHRYFHDILRDLIPLIFLIFFNVLILIALKQSTNRRKKLEKEESQ